MILDIPPALETTLQETANRRGISKERLAYEYIQHMATIPPTKSYANGDFNFDLDSIQASIESGIHPMPKFANKEEFLAWVNT